jgi:hypothetical protein
MNATTKANLNNLTSNQYYGGLNRRFERRAALLRRLGFTYQRIEGMPVAVFGRGYLGKSQAIPAAVLHHADNRAWFEELARTLKH